MPTTQPTLHVSSVSPSLVGGQRTLVVEHGEREGDVTLVSFGGWNFPRRRVVDDHVGTRDGLTPVLQLPASAGGAISASTGSCTVAQLGMKWA